MAVRLIFAPDLPASLRWYADVLNLPVEAVQADPPTLRLPGPDTLVFSAQAQPAGHILPVDSVTAARQRFEHRPVVPGENQGRIVAAGPGHLALIDPANNQLTLLEPGSGGLADLIALSPCHNPLNLPFSQPPLRKSSRKLKSVARPPARLFMRPFSGKARKN